MAPEFSETDEFEAESPEEGELKRGSASLT